MKKKKYEEFAPEGELIQVTDFLPPPEELVFPKDTTIKVTLELTLNSINFFKRQAKKNHTKYQRMIREVVDRYARGSQKT